MVEYKRPVTDAEHDRLQISAAHAAQVWDRRHGNPAYLMPMDWLVKHAGKVTSAPKERYWVERYYRIERNRIELSSVTDAARKWANASS